MGCRAAETGIVMAADRLYENLPEAARNELADFPYVLRDLKVQALDARAFMAELEATMSSDAGVASAELTHARDEAQQGLAETVTALEAIRLALQWLEDGTGTVQGVTAELAAAREISEAVDRIREGWREVDEAVWENAGG